MACISIVYVIVANGMLMGRIAPTQGIRQGDVCRLTFFLFVLGT
jgi:uncharacterized membrane protein YcjF (UPF0283 family)